MPVSAWYGECPRCHRIRSFPTREEARKFEEECERSHDVEFKAYTAPHDPKMTARF